MLDLIISVPDHCLSFYFDTAINSLNRGKAPDVYGLPVENVLQGGEQLKLVLLDVINDIFMAGAVPENLKCGLITPISKRKA